MTPRTVVSRIFVQASALDSADRIWKRIFHSAMTGRSLSAYTSSSIEYFVDYMYCTARDQLFSLKDFASHRSVSDIISAVAMNTVLNLLLLVLACLYSICFSSPTPQAPPTISTSQDPNITALESRLLCTSPDPFQKDLRPHFADCAIAMTKLPSKSKNGKFFRTLPKILPIDRDFLLPNDKTYGDCQVSVEITATEEEPVPASNWVEIGLALVELNMACVKPDASMPGGITYTGSKNGLKVTLKGIKPELGNSSSAAVDSS